VRVRADGRFRDRVREAVDGVAVACDEVGGREPAGHQEVRRDRFERFPENTDLSGILRDRRVRFADGVRVEPAVDARRR
jgi:hypothetical protein